VFVQTETKKTHVAQRSRQRHPEFVDRDLEDKTKQRPRRQDKAKDLEDKEGIEKKRYKYK
jgi:hypothetical protein